MTLDRRRFIALSAAAVATTACGLGGSGGRIEAQDPKVSAAEARRRRRGAAIVERTIVAKELTLDLAGRPVQTWGYQSPQGDPAIRMRAGDVLRVRLDNELPEPTSIHWHGIALRNDMDGVPGLTQRDIAPQRSFTYEFTAPAPGTYFFHPHTGLQLDRALYAPLIIDDPADAGGYDTEHLVVLDDWLDDVLGTPEEVFADLSGTMAEMDHGSGGMATGTPSDLLGGDAGDVDHPMHLINGRPPEDRPTFDVPAGGRARLRFINAASDTAYRVSVGGHRLRVTHADGFPVIPVETDALLIGMGERYDAIVEPASGAWPLVASAEGKRGGAVAVVRTSDAAGSMPPPADLSPASAATSVLADTDLRPAEEVRLARSDDAHILRVELGMARRGYEWTINGDTHPGGLRSRIREGERVRLRFRNRSPMWHPMHLHGHTFALRDGGVRKDTVKVLPGESFDVDFDADNPGQWMLHCHNTYHLEAGMAAIVGYFD